ncbi:hypothetical protein ColTof4_14374 [Colletotrichum tofieldiae]|nr:hypothetical protein ColTof3_14785 [Colletotrichum tofieldiae]GKT81951.1 hypothetical protein ColTof4_14374 [Colletotrichum tofieldiae]
MPADCVLWKFGALGRLGTPTTTPAPAVYDASLSSGDVTPKTLSAATTALKTAVEELALAIDDSQESLVKRWKSLQVSFAATNPTTSFAEYVQSVIPAFALITILRAVFARDWEQLKTKGKTETSRRESAASRLGLQETWELYLWFGASVQSQRCWKSLPQGLSYSAKDLFYELEKIHRERTGENGKHYAVDSFQPRVFAKAAAVLAGRQSQANDQNDSGFVDESSVSDLSPPFDHVTKSAAHQSDISSSGCKGRTGGVVN